MSYFQFLIFFLIVIRSNGQICGFPGLPFGGKIDGIVGKRFLNDQIVSYSCISIGFVLFPRGNGQRTCKNGTWTNIIPKCGKIIYNNLSISKYLLDFKIKFLNLSVREATQEVEIIEQIAQNDVDNKI